MSYREYDALDAEMDLSDFANTQFGQGGEIVSSAGFTPGNASRVNAGHTPGMSQARPKSVNWPDENEGGILVDTNEWGEWGSATPGPTPGESASRQHISNEQYTVAAVAADVANAEADVDADADAMLEMARNSYRENVPRVQSPGSHSGKAPGSPIASTGAPRGILSRAVSRAVQNTVSNRGMTNMNAASNNNINFDQSGFSSNAFNFDEIETPASDNLKNQKYNNKYLEYRAKQIKARVSGGPNGGNKPNRHERTDTIVSNHEILPPVVSTKLLTQGIQQYELINSSVDLEKELIANERKQKQAYHRQQLDMDRVSTIEITRKPVPRLDPSIEKTGFLIGSQLDVNKNRTKSREKVHKRQTRDDWRKQLEADQAALGIEESRKAIQRRAFTPAPFGHLKPSEEQLAKHAEPKRKGYFDIGEEKRRQLREHREDVRSEIAGGSYKMTLADIRRAKANVGGMATYQFEQRPDFQGWGDSLSQEMGQGMLASIGSWEDSRRPVK
jgi:hypothetical protein